MIDIQGLEDFYGDMDFKVAGTHKGITSIQMDLKIDGLTPEIIKSALEMTHKGRDYIIDECDSQGNPRSSGRGLCLCAEDDYHAHQDRKDQRGHR